MKRLSRTAELLFPTLDSKPEEVVPSVPVYYSDIQETVQSFRVSQQHIQPSIFLRGLTFVKMGNMSGQEENVHPSKSSTRQKVLLLSELGR